MEANIVINVAIPKCVTGYLRVDDNYQLVCRKVKTISKAVVKINGEIMDLSLVENVQELQKLLGEKEDEYYTPVCQPTSNLYVARLIFHDDEMECESHGTIDGVYYAKGEIPGMTYRFVTGNKQMWMEGKQCTLMAKVSNEYSSWWVSFVQKTISNRSSHSVTSRLLRPIGSIKLIGSQNFFETISGNVDTEHTITIQ